MATVGLRERWLSPPGARQLMATATATHWSERTWPALTASARLSGQERQLLLGCAADPDLDLVRVDALAVIERIQQMLSPSATPTDREERVPTHSSLATVHTESVSVTKT
jgi:hypothetical protein